MRIIDGLTDLGLYVFAYWRAQTFCPVSLKSDLAVTTEVKLRQRRVIEFLLGMFLLCKYERKSGQ